MTETLRWRKSTYSGGGEGDTCVEIASLPTRIAIRDSKAPSQGTLSVLPDTFTTFVEALKPSGDTYMRML
ncbi:DUF397 domain-containing protein [Streptomyces sp. NPDC056039]|uniref:DUF397 domain-containing protein n=1 Tax=Streptomyces TaxID=1883 RepID=UPI0035DB3694